jgi:hypothetical protein
LANEAEARIIRAAFAVISGDSGLSTKFRTIRLVETYRQITDDKEALFGPYTMGVVGQPVTPADFPSGRERVFVDLTICPMLPIETTIRDSDLVMTELFNDVRKLLYGNLPLQDKTVNPAVNVSDAVVDLAWKGILLSEARAVRVPVFVARYGKDINAATGAFN